MGLSSQDENSFGLNAFLLWFLDLRYREFRLSSDCHHIHQFTVYCLLRSMQGSFLFYLSSFIPFSLQVSSPITGNHPNILDVYIIQYILVLICILVKSGLLFFFMPSLSFYVNVLCSRLIVIVNFPLHLCCSGSIQPVVPNCYEYSSLCFHHISPFHTPSDVHPRCFQLPNSTAQQEQSLPVSPYALSENLSGVSTLWSVRYIF